MSTSKGSVLCYSLLFFLLVEFHCNAQLETDGDGFLSTNTTWSMTDPETLVGSLTLQSENNASAFLITHIVYQSVQAQINSWSFLSFVQASPNEYYFCIVVSGTIIQALGDVAWTANSLNPVSANASLELRSDGNMVLWDSNPGGSGRRMVWASDTGGKGVSGGRLLGGGVMEMLDNRSDVIWQSGDYPTDTLLQGQILRTGDKLRSRSSRYNLTQGAYVLRVKPRGLGLYVKGSNPTPELYWLWNTYNNSARTLDDDLGQQCSGYNVSIQWRASQLALNFDNMSSGVCNGLSLSPYYYLSPNFNGSTNFSSRFMFLRLDYDGNLRAYESGITEPMYHVLSKCQLPSSCGKYGICTGDEACECPNNGTHHLERVSNGDCVFSNPPTCSNADGNWQMFALSGVDYYRNQYAVPILFPSKENCSDYCMQNCSCRASFYAAESMSCFVVSSEIGTIAETGKGTQFAFIKLRSSDIFKNSKPKGERFRKKTAIVAGISAFVVLIALIWINPFKHCRNSKKEASIPGHSALRVMNSIPDLTARKFSIKEMEKITRNFSNVLGSGGFGTVYEGLLKNGKKVAVKRLELARQGEKEFYSEVAILGIIHHWNLVQLLGFCSEKSHRILVYEHMYNGSLDKFLFDDNNKPFLTWPIRFNIILDTARGLAYLHHQCQYKIVHLDVKPQNILLDENFAAKVSDFGMATLMNRKDSRVMTSMRGTPGYLAPEWLLECAVTEKSDVYSFGMVVLEIVGGRKNYCRRDMDSEKRYFPAWALSMASNGRELDVVDPSLDQDLVDREQVLRVVRVAFLCIQEDAHSRPSMGAVVQMLEGERVVPEPPLQQSFQFAIANQVSPQISVHASLSQQSFASRSPSTSFMVSR